MSSNDSESICTLATTSDFSSSDSEDHDGKHENGNMMWKILHKRSGSYDNKNVNHVASKSTYDSVNVYQSKQVHVGNVTYISRPISLNQKFVISDTKKKITKKITVFRNYETGEEDLHHNTNYVIHIEQTIKFSKNSYKKLFANALYKFMELCMQFIDGA
ncbi:hypothetical protein RN001_009714 [Aquatica leii]|uniref:Uncharacterized protein n=1 Tax=Aquatica leii TaxID=1421715 RepID=A0AAN7P709_9COLE|nr:hypothetical protein RN001_009714 [Aquatica leii]